jgi:hypothetical protein
MIGYKVLSRDGLKGPFKKSSIIKAITSAMLPLQAKLLEIHTGRYVFAAELVGEQIDPRASRTSARPEAREGRQVTNAQPKPELLNQMAEQSLPAQPLTLDEEAPAKEDTPRVVLMLGKMPLKKARLPRPRKMAQLHNPAA